MADQMPAWEAGFQAYGNGQPAAMCPYDEARVEERIAWVEGWLAAHFQAHRRSTKQADQDKSEDNPWGMPPLTNA
jgi:ribosome modulation factor